MTMFRGLTRLFMGVVMAQLIACGGGDKDDGGNQTPNHPPAAAFTSSSSAVAGSALAFDASASTDPDNDTLTYGWDFGNGQRGGGEKIAAVFDAPGTFTVKLTVWDRRDGIAEATREITVSAGPTANGSVDSIVVARDVDGALLAGVTVTVVGGTASATTDGDGRAVIATPRGVPAVLRFAKSGYAAQVKRADVPSDVDGSYLEVTMRTRDGATTLANAAAGGTLTGRDGARVTFLPNTLVDSSGNAVSGAVDVAMTPIDVVNEVGAFPGRFEGLRATGEQGVILSYGTVEFGLEGLAGGVQLAPGKHATIEIPIYTGLNMQGLPLQVGDTIPLWSLNERTGGWTEEGVGTVVAGDQLGSFALLAEVTHFSWWNCDDFAVPAKPKPKCLVDTDHDGNLEDLTGTGFCWHYGTGPEATPTPFLVDRPGIGSFGVVAPTQPPAYAVSATTPVGGGVVLPIPANTDITLRSYAMNGTLFGTTIVNLAAGVEQDVVVVLDEVQENPGTLAVAMPYDEAFRINARNEVDRFTFTAEADAAFSVRVSRSAGSAMDGRVRVLDAAATQRAAADFGELDFGTTLSTGSGGTFTVEITGIANVPGSYRLELEPASIPSGCENPSSLTLPSTTADLDIDGATTLCFGVNLAADAALSITSGNHPGYNGTVRVFGPGGEQIAVDAVDTNAAVELRVAVAQAAQYRIEIANTQSTAGSIEELVIETLTPAGVITAPNSITYTSASTPSNERWYIVKRASPTSPVAVSLNGNGTTQGMNIFPGDLTAFGSGVSVRIAPPSELTHALVRVYRQNPNSAWNFTLSGTTPTEVPFATDIDLNASGDGLVAVYTLTATPGQRVSMGVQENSGVNPVANIFAPTTGAQVNPTMQNRVYTLADGGTYTLVVSNFGPSSGAFQFRINAVAAAEAVTLGGTVERDVTLALGEIRLYSFNLTQAQVVAIAMSSPDPIDVDAVILGGNVYDGFAKLEFGTPPRTAFSGARYVQQSAAANLIVYSPSRSVGEATGSFTVQLHAPTSSMATIAQLLSQTIAPGALRTYAYEIPADAKYMLCTQYDGGAQNFNSAVWGPTAQFTNYFGDIISNFSVVDGRMEVIDDLRAGTNKLSITSLTNASATVDVSARLIWVSDAVALTVGGAATPGSASWGCERKYYTFAGVGGQAYEVRLTALFDGSVRVRKLPPNGDYSVRTDPPFSDNNLGGTPVDFVDGDQEVVAFTIPATTQFGDGTYVIEVDPAGDVTGSFQLRVLAAPVP